MIVKEFSFLNIERDLKIVFAGDVSPDFGDSYERETDRMIEVSLQFTVEGFLYLPVSTNKIIKIINSEYFIDDVSINSYELS